MGAAGNGCCQFREPRGGMDGVTTTRSSQSARLVGPAGVGSRSAVAQALEGVPARLRRVREKRGLTLTQVAAQTGLSKSTLSRLETGQRRPSLELLLPLAQVYRVPIDDLVGAPDVADPRIRLKPRRLNGRTVLPLTDRLGCRRGRSSCRSPR